MIRRWHKISKNIWPYLLMLPALCIMAMVVFYPILSAIGMSFQYYDLRFPKKIAFVGLDNYIQVFTDKIFLTSLKNTFIWVVFGVGFQFVFGFMLALLLNRPFKGRAIARSVSLIPWVTPGVLIALMWRWILDGNYGVLNDLLLKLGIVSEKIPFLATKEWAMPAVLIAIVWQGIPFFALMLLAGLQSISHDLYEAAAIDGATTLQKFRYVTVPAISNTILTTTMLRVIWVANSVDVIFNMTEGGPAYASQTLSVYIYQKANVLNMGYASAMAIIMTLLLLTVSILYLRKSFQSKAV